MDRRTALSTIAVLGVTAVLITVLIVRQADISSSGGPGDVGEARLPDVTSPSAGGAAPSTAPAAGAESLESFVDEAVDFVERTRGMPFVEEPVVVALPETEFVSRVDADLVEDFAEDPARVDMYDAVYRAFGLIGPTEEIDEVYRAFGAAGILGFYDPETDELVVRQLDELSLLTKSTIVHELTHAFDDQHYDLDRPDYDDRTDEIPWTFSAVAEGSASHVESLWKDTLSDVERTALLREELGFADPSIFDRFELAFLWLELSPYEAGEPFVDHVVDTGGYQRLGALLTEPPATSEQVLDVEALEEGEVGTGVAVPPADGEVVASGVGGQVLLESLFVGVDGDYLAASQGWGDDRYVIWLDAPRTCLRWDLQADSPQDLEELRSALRERFGADAVSAVDAATVRVDRCV